MLHESVASHFSPTVTNLESLFITHLDQCASQTSYIFLPETLTLVCVHTPTTPHYTSPSRTPSRYRVHRVRSSHGDTCDFAVSLETTSLSLYCIFSRSASSARTVGCHTISPAERGRLFLMIFARRKPFPLRRRLDTEATAVCRDCSEEALI
jgi:hypothetical protein